VSVLAIYVIALTTILSAFAAPPAASATLDPFAVICHSAAPDAQTDTGPAPASLPSHACDHCTLCNVASSAAPPDFIVAGQLAAPALLHVLTPASHDARARFIAAQHQARGPPRFA
jgi:hypothetical protein